MEFFGCITCRSGAQTPECVLPTPAAQNLHPDSHRGDLQTHSRSGCSPRKIWGRPLILPKKGLCTAKVNEDRQYHQCLSG
ncbi:hypothetical protein ANANG_G00135340 [Anguilla anguilla]|uniref:Uncharacterized protein n=1 Tax=Anguilla anguilla TaxID=7936 RepID=A0A9D3MBR6_ANGAN|nr:hypothetical protein ANANG_G00135340 [Anguilla anguilla]